MKKYSVTVFSPVKPPASYVDVPFSEVAILLLVLFIENDPATEYFIRPEVEDVSSDD